MCGGKRGRCHVTTELWSWKGVSCAWPSIGVRGAKDFLPFTKRSPCLSLPSVHNIFLSSGPSRCAGLAPNGGRQSDEEDVSVSHTTWDSLTECDITKPRGGEKSQLSADQFDRSLSLSSYKPEHGQSGGDATAKPKISFHASFTPGDGNCGQHFSNFQSESSHLFPRFTVSDVWNYRLCQTNNLAVQPVE